MKPQKELVVRRQARPVALFVDGVRLDRAAKRLKRRVNYSALLSSLTAGRTLIAARYYTIIPMIDDSRQRSFFDAVRNVGFSTIIKRLPDIESEQKVSTDVEMALDCYSLALGSAVLLSTDATSHSRLDVYNIPANVSDIKDFQPILVCPSLELSYLSASLRMIGVKTAVADFGKYTEREHIKMADQWIDLSDIEAIWC